MFEMQQRKKNKPSQQLIRIAHIRDGVAILNDGTMRATLMVSSVNFALKSEDEQNAIVYAYQDFLNALDFPLQVTVSSRKMDITPYLEEVKERRNKQQNELLRLQMDEYINFVGELVKSADIMTKTFFITVPFSVQQNKREGFLDRFFKSAKGVAGKLTLTDQEFEHNRAQLLQRVEQVAVGLRAIGLRLIPLQTQELLELFYTMYNPATSRNQRLHNAAQLKVQETEV
ncbi:MAG: hypothetical protein WEA04_01690 [Candidatus Andersenbacteria bacterium]